MQNSIVCTFRKRLQKRGYSQVSIFRCKDNISTYTITAVEPLSETLVISVYSLEKMQHSFR